MTSFDTNIAVHSANRDSPFCEVAREFLGELGSRKDIVICELMLVELYLKLCNAKIFRKPMNAGQAAAYCLALRGNRNWQVVDGGAVMEAVWVAAGKSGFAFRRIIDLRLGLTLLHHGVTHFATANIRDFQRLGFVRVWNPLQG